MKGLFGIHSPSTVMRDTIGINIAYGIGEGFDDGMDDVNKEIEKTLNRTVAIEPAPIKNRELSTESTDAVSKLANEFSRFKQEMAPVIEMTIKCDSETLYKQVLKGEKSYNGRHVVKVAY